jgi:hypothetical protein
VHRVVRLILALATIAVASPEPANDQIKDSLQEIVIKIRSTPEPRLDQLLTPAARKTMMPLMKELKLHLRDSSTEPMSELSPPLVFIRSVLLEKPDRANACVVVGRVGSLQGVTVATYYLIAVKSEAGWQVESLGPPGKCQNEPNLFLIGGPAVPQLQRIPPE